MVSLVNRLLVAGLISRLGIQVAYAQTLYYVSDAESAQLTVIYSESLTISAAGVGADGETTYIANGVASYDAIKFSDTTTTLLSTPSTYTLTMVESAGGLYQSGSGVDFRTCGFGADGHGTCVDEHVFGSETATLTYAGIVEPYYTLAAVVTSIPTPTGSSPVKGSAIPARRPRRAGLIGGIVAATVAIFIGAGVFLLLRIRRHRQQMDFFPRAKSQPLTSNDRLPDHPREPVTQMSSLPIAVSLLGGEAQGYASPPPPTERDAVYDPWPHATSSASTQSHAPSASSAPAPLYADLKQRQQEIVDEYKEGLRGRSGPAPTPAPALAPIPAPTPPPVIRHVDSGLRGGALNPRGSEPVELPPFYSPD
ncbi:hypothetical protein GGX14DRAFT_559564 [Mycena pura]|uniref:Uncharacterized protein n=1 Tax=Mycena pura TaxID=153505 RepID=A0AAD6VSV5_9AGAR|nr:hypothetical protein GGX14DRAFT_559564 [Mycena pura]